VNYIGECGNYYENYYNYTYTDDYLCGRCEGDCDHDSDCQPGLICYQRGGFESVPGCTGAGGSRDLERKDICINPNDLTGEPTATPTAMPTTGQTATPTVMPTTQIS
jgi:hypothetical protein